MSATLIMPAGFLLAGLFTVKDEPGFGVFLVPVGALLLIVAVGMTTFAIVTNKSQAADSKRGNKKKPD